jgi:hypothetical protein
MGVKNPSGYQLPSKYWRSVGYGVVNRRTEHTLNPASDVPKLCEVWLYDVQMKIGPFTSPASRLYFSLGHLCGLEKLRPAIRSSEASNPVTSHACCARNGIAPEHRSDRSRACDRYRVYRSGSAATPGSSIPARNSRVAPPPVEI